MRKLFTWIGGALSEKGLPSSKRFIALLFALTYLGCDVYNVVETGEYTVPNKIIDGSIMLILLGLATTAQFMEIYRGKSNPATPAPPTTDEQPK